MEDTMRQLFVDELKDMFSAEQQIIKALPKAIKACESADLKEALQNHLEETREQADRLKEVFDMIDVTPTAKTCKAMEGLIKEVEEVIGEYKKSPTRDAAIISKAQRVEHYEISAYGTLRTFAKELELDDAIDLFEKSLKEESNADKKLTKIAEGGLLSAGINAKANR